MASRLNPYITFAGDARQAMEFYADVFGGDLRLNTFGEYGDAGPNKDNVMHAMLETPLGFTLMASDMPPGAESGAGHTHGDRVSVSLSGDDEQELRGYWERLSASGSVVVPFEKQMWGDTFGQCTDGFGIAWMVNVLGAATTG